MMMGSLMTGLRRIMRFNSIQFIWVYRVLVMAFNFWVQLTNYLAIVLALQVKNKPYTVIALDKCLLMCGAYRWEYPMLLLHPMKLWYNTIQWQCNAMKCIEYISMEFSSLGSWAQICLFVFVFLLFSRLVVCFVFIVHLLCYSIDVDICEMCQFSLPQSWLSLVWLTSLRFMLFIAWITPTKQQCPIIFGHKFIFTKRFPNLNYYRASVCEAISSGHRRLTDRTTDQPTIVLGATHFA